MRLTMVCMLIVVAIGFVVAIVEKMLERARRGLRHIESNSWPMSLLVVGRADVDGVCCGHAGKHAYDCPVALYKGDPSGMWLAHPEDRLDYPERGAPVSMACLDHYYFGWHSDPRTRWHTQSVPHSSAVPLNGRLSTRLA